MHIYELHTYVIVTADAYDAFSNFGILHGFQIIFGYIGIPIVNTPFQADPVLYFNNLQYLHT